MDHQIKVDAFGSYRVKLILDQYQSSGQRLSGCLSIEYLSIGLICRVWNIMCHVRGLFGNCWNSPEIFLYTLRILVKICITIEQTATNKFTNNIKEYQIFCFYGTQTSRWLWYRRRHELGDWMNFNFYLSVCRPKVDNKIYQIVYARVAFYCI